MSTHHSSEGPGIPPWTMGWRLRRSLDWAGMTVQDMAEHLELSRSQISRFLNDREDSPRAAYLRAWATRTGVPLDWIVNGNDDPDPDDSHVVTTRGKGSSRSGWLRQMAVPAMSGR